MEINEPINYNHLDTIVTLTSLVSQDLPRSGCILLEFPSSSNRNLAFVNDEKFVIYDFPPPSLFYNEYLLPLRACPVAGNKVPLLLNGNPSNALQQHWRRWVPGYVEPVLKSTSEVKNEKGPIVVSFPHQSIPAEKHAVDPYVHYWVLSKHCIPYMGTTCPKHMSLDEYTLPCMLKAAHGKGTKGTYRVDTQEEMNTLLKDMDANLKSAKTPVITEVIENITGNYCLQFYLFKSGEIHWLGVTTQIIGKDLIWGGGVVDWNEQVRLKKLLYKTIVPVKEYLHKQGYFGVVGIDILSSKDDQYVIDVNPRINGSTPQLLLAPTMAELGYNVSIYLTDGEFQITTANLLKRINNINNDGESRVIALSMADVDDHCLANLVVFGESEEATRKIHEFLKSAE